MGKIKRYKNVIERFLSSEGGQRFFNVAYSLGAAVVIWGALFKILHLPGGNTLLAIGMGTEVLMFIITAFDRPSREYKWEEVFPVLSSKNPEDRPDFAGGNSTVFVGGGVNGNVASADGVASGGTVIAGGEISAVPAGLGSVDAEGIATATDDYKEQVIAISEQLRQLQETTRQLNEASGMLLQNYQAINGESASLSQGADGYGEQLGSLSRNISSLNAIYEIQLKSIASQLDSIERVNRGLKDIRDMYEKSSAESVRYCEETEKMAHNIKQLNSVYEKMLKAMTVNMFNPAAMGASAVDNAPAE